jgi:succinate dehydrogenase/fumarate reductase flavoprotein subunit
MTTIPLSRHPGAGDDEDGTRRCDTLVVGSGATGLVAAITARLYGQDVLVVEKDAFVGGCSAYSFGMLWMPCNPVAHRKGVPDDRAAALAYLRAEMGPRFDETGVAAYLDHGPRMVEFLERHCGIQFELRENFPDYHSDLPGASQGARTIQPALYDARALGKDLKRLRPPRTSLFGMSLTPAENRLVSSKSPAGLWHLAKRSVRHLADLALHGRSTLLAGGNALVAALFNAANGLGVPILTRTSLQELVVENGRVVGAIVESAGRRHRIDARCGVVLACGGAGHDVERCRPWFGHRPLHGQSWSLAPDACAGDGLRAALAAGAALERDTSNAAFWVPVSRHPDHPGALSTHSHDRCSPGFLAVTGQGKRFVNEAQSNHHFCEALLRTTAPDQVAQAWLVCDRRAIGKLGMGDMIYGWPFPLDRHVRSGYLLKRPDLASLAAAMQVDPATFARTVERFNADARAGHDTEFGKGTTAFNRALSRATFGTAPCLGPLEQAPFFAVKLTVGYFATLNGLRADLAGQALDEAGQPIPGLYLTGNDRANLFRGECPGGGITLGPGMTWAYLTGRHLAEPHATEHLSAA